MTEIITQFNEYSGIIRCGSGYGDCSRVDRDRLIALLQKLPPGDVIISSITHDEGRGVFVKPADLTEPVWHVLTPSVEREEPKGLYRRARALVGL